MKVEIKDINKYLSLKSKIVVTGKYSISVVGRFLNNLRKSGKNLVKKAKENLAGGVKKIANVVTSPVSTIKGVIIPTEEEKQEKIDKQTKKIDEEIDEMTSLVSNMEQDDEFQAGIKSYYLEETKKELEKLKSKKLELSKKGLSIFALSKMSLLGLRKRIKKIWTKEENKTVDTEVSDIEDAKKQLKENLETFLMLKEEEKEILEQYPDIDSQKIKSVTDSKQEEKEILEQHSDIDSEEIKSVTGIKKPDESLKNRILNSSKLKKGLAILATFAAVSLSFRACSDKPVNNNIGNNDTTTGVTDVVIDEEEKEQKQEVKLGNYLTLKDNSKIYSNSEMNFKHGIIGTNGYTGETLFKVNAITYVDSNNVETTFNLVQKSESAKSKIEQEHQNFINNNQNLVVKNFHVTPCDDLGIPVSMDARDIDLGGWTNTDNAEVEIIDNNQVFMNTYQSLGGKQI